MKLVKIHIWIELVMAGLLALLYGLAIILLNFTSVGRLLIMSGQFSPTTCYISFAVVIGAFVWLIFVLRSIKDSSHDEKRSAPDPAAQ